MADSAARISIQLMVRNFVKKFKGNEDDYFNYLMHAQDCFRDLNISHLPYYTEAKVTVTPIGTNAGIVVWPIDMIDFISVGLPKNGVFWTFTERRDMNTTTTGTYPAETFTSTLGDGETFDVPEDGGVDYGVRGGVNDYYYFIDWADRRIYLDGDTGTTVILRYVSSGITSGSETYVPVVCTRAIDTYLRWMEAQMNKTTLGDVQLRKQDYDEALMWLRRQQMPTMEQFRDALYGVTTQVAQR